MIARRIHARLVLRAVLCIVIMLSFWLNGGASGGQQLQLLGLLADKTLRNGGMER